MTVGCGRHTAQIVDRDGQVLTEATVLTRVEWSRALDDVSDARIVVSPDDDCCGRLGQVRAWRHRLDIWRDDRFAWSGPIIRPRWTPAGVEIDAVDVLGWLDRRVPHDTVTFFGRELTEVAEWLIRDGYAPDDPGHRVRTIAPSRIYGDRAYEAGIGQTGDHLRDLAATGIDYTAVGADILLLPEDHHARIGSLTDDDFPDGLTVTEDGAALATRVIVHGRDDVRGEAGGHHPYYGLLERAVEETSILDDRSATAAARARLRASMPAPVMLDTTETTLSPDAPVEVTDLVPGWSLDVTTTQTCRTVSQSLRILGMRVRDSDDGEQIGLQLSPAGL